MVHMTQMAPNHQHGRSPLHSILLVGSIFIQGIVLFAAGSPALADAQPGLTAADRAAIESAIRQQIAAFGRDDALEAFMLASPGIQARFKTPEGFMEMVRGGYPAVYRPREVSFLDIVEMANVPVQRVKILGPNGGQWIAFYPMWRDFDGIWRIDGCSLAPLQVDSA